MFKLVKSISIAPLMGISNTYSRRFWRILTKKTILYSEMIVDKALLRMMEQSKKCSEIEAHVSEEPLVYQLGGNRLEELVPAVKIISNLYENKEMLHKVNINMGCPSSKVMKCSFGASLMKDPGIFKCMELLQKSTSSNISIKCRIGVDDSDYAFLENFIKCMQMAGIKEFIIHARKAIQGLSTIQNRTIPPLQYDQVYSIKKTFPDLNIIINGGISSWYNYALYFYSF